MRFAVLTATALLGVLSHCKVVQEPMPPSITPAPKFDIRQLERSLAATSTPIEPVSLAEVLLTAVPESLREIAATNPPEASLILWSAFLDGNRPSWFTAMPTDVQEYLISEFAPSTTSGASSTDSAAATSKSSSSSAAAFVTSFVTVTATPGPAANASNFGLSTSTKIAIGLGVPLLVLLIVTLILACFVIRQRCRRTHLGHHDHVDDRPPTPAFLDSTRAPGKTTTIRGASSGHLTSESDLDYDKPFADPPRSAMGAMRQARNSRGSFVSLKSVPEEDHHGPARADPLARGPRRSKKSFMDLKQQQQPTVTTSPWDPARGSAHDWQHQHPALRVTGRNSLSSPYGTYDRVARKPVPPNENFINYGNQCAASSQTNGFIAGPQANSHSNSSSSFTPPRRGGWPLGSGGKFDGRSSYWKVQAPKYDQYEKVDNGS